MSGVDRETCQERMRQVEELARRGWTNKKIARHTGFSLPTVYRYRRHIRLGSVPVGSGDPNLRQVSLFDDPVFASKAAGLYESGLTMLQVAADLGVCKATVGRALHARGVPVRSSWQSRRGGG